MSYNISYNNKSWNQIGLHEYNLSCLRFTYLALLPYFKIDIMSIYVISSHKSFYIHLPNHRLAFRLVEYFFCRCLEAGQFLQCSPKLCLAFLSKPLVNIIYTYKIRIKYWTLNPQPPLLIFSIWLFVKKTYF